MNLIRDGLPEFAVADEQEPDVGSLLMDRRRHANKIHRRFLRLKGRYHADERARRLKAELPAFACDIDTPSPDRFQIHAGRQPERLVLGKESQLDSLPKIHGRGGKDLGRDASGPALAPNEQAA